MRKEKLLEKKEEQVKNLTWYLKSTMTEEDLKDFSISQLKKICEMMEKAEEYRKSKEAFVALSATEVLQKETGRIAYFESDKIREESHEECRSGAAEQALDEYIRKAAQS